MLPLFKKAPVFQPVNYIVIHLTAQESKALERFLGSLLVTFVFLLVNFSQKQFANHRAREARDTIEYLVFTWLNDFNNKLKFAVQYSNESGAFDRVITLRMLDKFIAKSMRDDVVKVFDAWLAEQNCGTLRREASKPNQVKERDIPNTV